MVNDLGQCLRRGLQVEQLEHRLSLSIAFGVDELHVSVDRAGLEFISVSPLVDSGSGVGGSNMFLTQLWQESEDRYVIGRGTLTQAQVSIEALTDLNDRLITELNDPRILADGTVAVRIQIPEKPAEPFTSNRTALAFIPPGQAKPNRVELLDVHGPDIQTTWQTLTPGGTDGRIRLRVSLSDTSSYLDTTGSQFKNLELRGEQGRVVALTRSIEQLSPGEQKATAVYAFDATLPMHSGGGVEGGPYRLHGSIVSKDIAGNATERIFAGEISYTSGVWSPPVLTSAAIGGGVIVRAIRTDSSLDLPAYLSPDGTELLVNRWKSSEAAQAPTAEWHVVSLSTRQATSIQHYFAPGKQLSSPHWFTDGSVQISASGQQWIGSADLTSFSMVAPPSGGGGWLLNSIASTDGRIRLYGAQSGSTERERLWVSIDGAPPVVINAGDDHTDDSEPVGIYSRQTFRKNDPLHASVEDMGLTTLGNSLSLGLARIVPATSSSADVYSWQATGIASTLTHARLDWSGGTISITRPTAVDSGNLVSMPSGRPLERLFMALALPDGRFLAETAEIDGAGGGPKLLIVKQLGTRPVVFVPGIVGSWPKVGAYNEWLMNLGTAPDKLELDPLVRTYTDIMGSLEAHGYAYDSTLFAAPYDWRVPWAPADAAIDGELVTGLTPDQLLDFTYQYGIDYLGDALRRARQSWQAQHGRPLDSVDLIAHSMGGLIARSYIQSDIYGGQLSNGETLPVINEFVAIATPHQGASKAWNLINGNFIADPVYQQVFASVSFDAFNRVFHKNQTIQSTFGAPIDQARVIAQAAKPQYAHLANIRLGDMAVPHDSNQVQLHAAFMDLFAPAGASLIAVYDFIDADRDENGRWTPRTGGGSLPGLRNLNDDPNRRNTILLDLNAGDTASFDPLLRQWRFDEWTEDGGGPATVTFPLPGGMSPRNAFAERARTTVVAGTGLPTLSLVRAVEGPLQRDGDVPPPDEGGSAIESVFFMERGGVRPNADWLWFMDLYPWTAQSVSLLGGGYEALQQSLSLGAFGTSEGSYFGDATVPMVSGYLPFVADARVVYFNVADDNADHGGLMQHPDVQKYALRMLGVDVRDAAIRSGSQTISLRTVGEIISLLRDPVEGFLVDDQGRRVGWSAATGHINEIPNSFSFGDGDGISFVFNDSDTPMNLRLALTGTGAAPLAIVTRSTFGQDSQILSYRPELSAGQSVVLSLPPPGSAQVEPADAFIVLFGQLANAGFVAGDSIVTELHTRVPNAAYGSGYWGGTNYWFQDSIGDVWSLWHGGPVHASAELPGQHNWLLTNLTDAAGLSGEFGFDLGSLSGIATGWNAFNIQGVADGKLSALWWSPGGSAGQYLDTDGVAKQGQALGRRGNGWVLSSISDALIPSTSGLPLPGPLRPFTESQGNGRTTFDPRPTRAVANDGMSIVVVDTSDRAYVVSFSVWQRPIAGADPALDRAWIVEPIGLVPSIADFQLGPLLPAFEQDYIAAAK